MPPTFFRVQITTIAVSDTSDVLYARYSLEAEIVLGWFGGPVGFRAAHQQPCDLRLTEKMEVYLS